MKPPIRIARANGGEDISVECEIVRDGLALHESVGHMVWSVTHVWAITHVASGSALFFFETPDKSVAAVVFDAILDANLTDWTASTDEIKERVAKVKLLELIDEVADRLDVPTYFG